ncbi:MAG: preprotein translocase subunit SecY, partial [Nitrosopumilaceae archaeon]
MAEGGTLTSMVRKMVSKAEPYIPQVPKPKKKLTLQNRLKWCGLILLIYMVMGQTPLFGATTPEFDFLAFARVIFASQQGTLVELGIGPIVTAGLLMQLLKGSEILRFDFKKPEERGIFQTATKIVTYIVIVAESAVYGVAVYGPGIAEPSMLYILIGQLMGASVIIMLLDETIQKGWGLGSGISLFIMAGVAQQILWSIFSPLPAGDGGTIGILPYIGQSIMAGDLSQVFFRSNQLPSIFGLLLTGGVMLILIYTQGMKIEIPIVSTKYRGFSAVYPIKLMYVSNIPVILASALTANALFMGQMMWANLNPRNAQPFLNFIFQYDPTSPATPIGGLVYYITPPRGLEIVALDPMRAVGYILFMIAIVVVFGKLWVELGGLSPKSAAKNLLDADVQIPGFRRSNQPIEVLLNKYIPSVTLIGSMILG